MKKDRLLVTLVLLAVMSAGCVAGSQPVTPSDSNVQTTTDDAGGALAVDETTNETATETTETPTETATETATATETETQTATTTMTPHPTTTEIPLNPPVEFDWTKRFEAVDCDDGPGEKEKLIADVSFTNPNEYGIHVATGLHLVKDDGTKVSVAGDSKPTLEPGATWETSFSYESDCNGDLDNIAEINVANHTGHPQQTNPGH